MGKLSIVTSGKGGTGVSCLASVFAASAAESGRRVLLADLAAGNRTQDFLMSAGELLLYDLADAAHEKCALQDVWQPSLAHEGVWVLAAPGRYAEMPSPARTAELLRQSALYFDEIIVDCPAGSPQLGELVRDAASVTVCSTPELLSIRACNALREEFSPYFAGEARLVISLFDENDMLAISGNNDLDAVIDGVGLRLLGVVPWDGVYAQWLASGDPRVKKTEAWAAMSRCYARLCGEKIPLYFKK